MSRSSTDLNSLIPETPLLLYPSLAATIGLEEATLLAALTGYARSAPPAAANNSGYQWFTLNLQQLHELVPFWQPADIQRIITNLREQGIVIVASAPLVQSQTLKFAFNQASARPAATPKTVAPTTSQAPNMALKNRIAPGWQPDRETLARLSQHGIPTAFAQQQVPEFVNYWRERGETAHSWGSKFMKHALYKWREYEAQQNSPKQTTAMPRDWRPSADAMDVLTRHAGISREFIEDAIPEFELYWREQQATSDNWNKKFRDHVQRQWLRYRSALEHDTVPRRIPENWQPSGDVYEVLRLANIDIPFAQSLLPEFLIYWRDSNQVHSSWNTRFLQYVKQRWARRDTPGNQHHKSTRELTLAEQLTDRSWAL